MITGEVAGTGSATRRGFVGGLVVAGVSQALARPPVAAAAALPPCTPKAPGIRTFGLAVAPDGRTAWTTDSAATTITAHRGRRLARRGSIDVGGAPVDIDITRDGRFALVTTAHYDRPGLAIVDLRTHRVTRFDVGPEPGTVTHCGRIAWVAGGGADGTLTRVDLETGRVHAPIVIGSHPRGVAVDRHNRHAVVALNGQAAVAHVTLATGAVRHIATRAFPYRVAVSPDGRNALVTHNGFRDHAVTPLDLVRHRARTAVKVGLEPTDVAYTRSGRHALVAVMGAHAVTVVDGRTGRRRRTIRHLGGPRSVAVAGRHAIVADGAWGDLTRVALGAYA